MPSFEEGLQVFRDSGDDFGFRLDPPVDLSKEPDARSDEHEVWFLLGNGWRRLQANGNTAWLDETHQGNLIQTGDGVLVLIDFRIQTVSGAMLDAVAPSSARRWARDDLANAYLKTDLHGAII